MQSVTYSIGACIVALWLHFTGLQEAVISVLVDPFTTEESSDDER